MTESENAIIVHPLPRKEIRAAAAAIRQVGGLPAEPPLEPETLIGFFDALVLDQAYTQCGWNSLRYTELLSAIASDESVDPVIRMKAGEILETRALLALRAGGYVQSVKTLARLDDTGKGHLLTSKEELRLLTADSTKTRLMLEGVSDDADNQYEDDDDPDGPDDPGVPDEPVARSAPLACPSEEAEDGGHGARSVSRGICRPAD